jgi:hypothetical protein
MFIASTGTGWDRKIGSMSGLTLGNALQFSLAWLALCTLGYYLLPRFDWDAVTGSVTGPLFVLGFVLAIALLVRLVPAFVMPVGAEYDIESFRRVADTFLKGEPIYSSPVIAGRHPYLPFQLYLIGGMGKLSAATGVPFVIAIKLVPILADVALVGLIFHAALRMGEALSQAAMLSLLYGLSPIAILVSAYHGQFDAETILLLALAWFFWRFNESSPTRLTLSALLLGLAVSNKTWPLIFLPIVLYRLESHRQRFTYALATLAVPLAFTLFYILVFDQDPYPMLHRALTHAGVPGWWGVSAAINLTHLLVGVGEGLVAWLSVNGRWLVLGGVVCVYWLTRRESGIAALTTAILALYVLTAGFGLQWTLWVVPFAILAGDLAGLNLYTLGALAYMLPAYYGYHFDPLLPRMVSSEQMTIILTASAIPVWVVSVWWTLRRLIFARELAVAVRPSLVRGK